MLEDFDAQRTSPINTWFSPAASMTSGKHWKLRSTISEDFLSSKYPSMGASLFVAVSGEILVAE